MIVAAACTGCHAWLVKPALDEVLINKDTFYLYFIPAAILVTGIIKGLCSYIQVTSLAFMSQKIIEKLRIQVFKRIMNKILFNKKRTKSFTFFPKKITFPSYFFKNYGKY